MITTFDNETLALLAEHVRRVVQIMGFEGVSVHCRSEQPATAERTSEDAWLDNTALNSFAPRRAAAAQTSTVAELHIDLNAGPQGKLLIGAQGSHLEALQHIIRAILRRKLQEGIHLVVDVNGYRARREQTLMQLATSAARQALASGQAVTLEPMTASDRRILHTALAVRRDVRTESQGEEPKRQVVVRPIFH